jgi:hypothetical protein
MTSTSLVLEAIPVRKVIPMSRLAIGDKVRITGGKHAGTEGTLFAVYSGDNFVAVKTPSNMLAVDSHLVAAVPVAKAEPAPAPTTGPAPSAISDEELLRLPRELSDRLNDADKARLEKLRRR